MRRSACLVLLLAGCAPDLAASRAAVNGTVDSAEEWSGVLGMRITKPEGVASCTGVLIAPNLVLTARHCVSSTAPAIVCGSSPFDDPVDGPDVLSTNDVTVMASSVAVRGLRVEVPPDGNDECGFDIAAVILQAEVPGGGAPVYPPRLDAPVTVGETFTAVGYGTTGSGGLGTRRFDTEVTVECLGAACGIPEVQESEWVSSDGSFCQSDSGAPAIDASGRVIGIISKGINPCQTPVLSSVYAWRDWIRSVGQMAAETGGYAPAAWVGAPDDPDGGPPGAADAGPPVPGTDAGVGGADGGPSGDGEGGCAARPAGGASGWLAAAILGLALALRRRR